MLCFLKNSKFEFLAFIFWIYNFNFVSCHVMWMLKLIPHLSLYCSHFKFSSIIPLDDISSEFGQNCNFLFLAFFFSIVPFYFVFMAALKIIPDLSFYYSHFNGLKFDMLICILTTFGTDFGHGLLIFLFLVTFWLSETGKIWGVGGIS